MAIYIRRADLEADRELLIDVLSRHLSPLATAPRFEWLYRRCPHGPAHAWIAADGAGGPVVGVAASFPRRMFVAGEIVPACVLGDFWIHSQYRSLGPALQLQRACLEDIDSTKMALAYDFPSRSMTAIYRRLGIPPQDEMVRLAKPMRVDREVAKSVRMRTVARGLSKLGNWILAWRDGAGERANGCTISLEAGPCGEEFTALAQKMSACYGVCVERLADYLNWRYRTHPLRRYEILAARREGTLVGYVVFLLEGEDASIVDLFAIEEEVLSSLVQRVVTIMRKCGAITVSASVLTSDPRRALLERLGFRARESRPVVVYLPRQPATPDRHKGLSWFLMDGDRES